MGDASFREVINIRKPMQEIFAAFGRSIGTTKVLKEIENG